MAALFLRENSPRRFFSTCWLFLEGGEGLAGPRQPTDLLVLKGKKHLTKEEIKERKNSEISAPNDDIKPQNYLNKSEKREFNRISKELLKTGIISNLDIDSLSFFIKTRSEYLKLTKEIEIRDPVKIIQVPEKDEKGFKIGMKDVYVVDETYADLLKLQLKVVETCRKIASDLGLSITSRCRLVVPTAKEEKKENKFAKFM